jgi:hypothetical protein
MKRSFGRFCCCLLRELMQLGFSSYGDDEMSREPLLDVRNPCYSSTVSASSFLKNVSGSFVSPPASREQYLLSFLARLVYPSTGIVEDILASSSFLFPSYSFSQTFLNVGAPSDDVFVPFSPTIGVRHSFQSLSMPLPNVPAKRPASLLNNNGDSRPRSSLVLGLSLGKRKYASLRVPSESSTFSDLCGSSKRMRSSLTPNQSSFEVVKADPFVDLADLSRPCSDGVELEVLDITSYVSPSANVDSSAHVRGSCLLDRTRPWRYVSSYICCLGYPTYHFASFSERVLLISFLR